MRKESFVSRRQGNIGSSPSATITRDATDRSFNMGHTLFWSDLLHGGFEMLVSARVLNKFAEAIRHRDHASLLRTDGVNRNDHRCTHMDRAAFPPHIQVVEDALRSGRFEELGEKMNR